MTKYNTGNRNTGNYNIGDGNTGDGNTGAWNTGHYNTGSRNTGNYNTGDDNTGNRNTGYYNTGDSNTGDSNTGNWNTGNRNTGYYNTGDSNTGDSNTGNWNTGNYNTGDCNTGHRNTGNRNTGNWNTGNWNAGFLNTNEGRLSIFNKETSATLEEIDFPDFFYFELSDWVPESEMTDKEKKAYPSYVTTGGYLKVRDYKQAFIESWEDAPQEDRDRVKKLPNFDADIFYQISGIRVNGDPKVKCTLDGKDVWISRDSYESLKKHFNN